MKPPPAPSPSPRAPRRRRPPRRLAALVSVGLAGAGGALAEDPPQASVKLSYLTPPGVDRCPREDALRAAVGARLGYDPFRDDAMTLVGVTVEREGRGLRARLMMHHGADASAVRVLRSATGDCDELAAAVAVAISVAIDPLRASSAPAASPSVSASASTVVALPRPAPLAPAPPPPAPSPPAPAGPPPPTSASAERPASLRLELSLGGLAALGAEPAPSIGVSGGAAARGAGWSIALEGRIDRATSTAGPAPTVSSSLALGELVPCARRGALAGCLLGAVGAITGRGTGVAFPAERSALYAAVGARIAYQLDLSDAFGVRVAGDLLAPLRRANLRVDETTFWQTPSVGGALGVAAVLSF